MDYTKRFFCYLFAGALLLSTGSFKTASAQTAPPLGTSQNFAVLGASAVTNVVAAGTVVNGNLGIWPNGASSITGFPPGIVVGTIHAADGVAQTAQADALTAYNYLAGESCPGGNNLTGQDLGGKILLPGVYCFPGTSAQLTGTLTLDSTANPNSVFIFQIGSTLTTASNSAVVVENSTPCNVFFQVGSSATIGTGTQLLGSIFALQSITLNTSANVTGGAYALNAAVTMDDNSVTACMGTLQICKVAGSSSLLGESFGFSIAGSPATQISVQAGPAPGGSCSVALLVPAHPAIITESIPVNTTLAGVATLPAPGLLLSSNLATGTATVAIDPAGQTIATFVDTVPPPPTTGFLQICKIAGSGITLGTPFTFNAGGTIVNVPAGAAPGGTCSSPLVVTAGQTPIAETLPGGTALTAVTTLPAGLLDSSNLAAGTATVTVAAAGQTIVTFLNSAVPVVPTTGSLQICKVAGAGVVVGTNFSFSVGGIPVTVPAGLAPGGTCSAPLVVSAGPTQITETLPSGTALTSVSTLPAGLLDSSNLAAGTATVTVTAGGQTIATFLNTSPMGVLKICKIAGTGVPVGGMFSFMVAGAGLTIPAGLAPGTCSLALVFPIGTVVPITETVSSGTIPSAISVVPAGAGSNINVSGGSVTATIGAGETDVYFTNTAGGVGLLKVCKVAGTGVAPLTMFGFVMNGTGFSIPAGYCVSRGTFPVGTVVTITENLSALGTVSAINVVPAGAGSGSVANRSATVAVGVGTTEVSFTNVNIR